jgi:hypothetical protein
MRELVIRQRFNPGTTGDKAEVTRVLESPHRVYVEVEHTHDACECTIMVAINRALKDYDTVDLEKINGKEENSQQDSET